MIQPLEWNCKVTFLNKPWALVRKYLRLAREELSASMITAAQLISRDAISAHVLLQSDMCLARCLWSKSIQLRRRFGIHVCIHGFLMWHVHRNTPTWIDSTCSGNCPCWQNSLVKASTALFSLSPWRLKALRLLLLPAAPKFPSH